MASIEWRSILSLCPYTVFVHRALCHLFRVLSITKMLYVSRLFSLSSEFLLTYTRSQPLYPMCYFLVCFFYFFQMVMWLSATKLVEVIINFCLFFHSPFYSSMENVIFTAISWTVFLVQNLPTASFVCKHVISKFLEKTCMLCAEECSLWAFGRFWRIIHNSL